MINQFEATEFLAHQLPELKTENNTGKIHDMVRQFLAITISGVKERNMQTVRHCFALAASLYETGNAAVRNTIENVYIYSFSDLLCIARENKKEIRQLIPLSLYAVYMNQVCHSGY